MSDLLITELAKCTSQKSVVQTCNSSNCSALDLHLDHTDHTATQLGQIVDTIILLIFVQRYRHLSYSLYCHSYFGDELFSGCGYFLTTILYPKSCTRNYYIDKNPEW